MNTSVADDSNVTPTFFNAQYKPFISFGPEYNVPVYLVAKSDGHTDFGFNFKYKTKLR
mgnify:CR=1 FL=1